MVAHDLPSYYRQFGGFVISAAINKYIYISINQSFFPGYFLKYSETEHAKSYDEIRHPLLREALRMHEMPCNVEVISIADVPADPGLGSSGSFLVGLAHALHAYKRQPVTAEQLACEAIEIEMNLARRAGRQAGSLHRRLRGLMCQEYRPDEGVAVTPLRMSQCSLGASDLLIMFFEAIQEMLLSCCATRSSALRMAIERCSKACTLSNS